MRLHNGIHIVNGPSTPNVRLLDRSAMPWLETAASYGIAVDLDHFSKLSRELDREMNDITDKVQQLTGVFTNLDSGDQVSALLFKKLGLKQVRPKMTRSGDRESVENEVLEAIKHSHEVVPLILDFKECSKINGTYVKPMPKLARKAPDGTWRMYPNFSTTRIPSGRFACKEPNLLAIPAHSDRGAKVRMGFITKPGWKLLTCDLCFHPDTLVETLQGPRPISSLGVGDKVLTHRNGRIKYGEVTKSIPIAPLPAWSLTFDDQDPVISSIQHKWPIKIVQDKKPWTIEERTTAQLKVGQRMVPCNVGTSGTPEASYKTWYSRSFTEYTKQHQLIAEAFLGPCPEGYHVHHKDEDKGNNDISNLEYKAPFDHWSDHGKEHYKTQDHEYRISKLREGLRGRRSYDGLQNPNAKIGPALVECIRTLAASGTPTSEIAGLFDISYGHTRQIIRGDKGITNHKLTSKTFVGMQPMWAITVEPDHNYVLSCGVVTHNSQIEMRVAAHRSKSKALIEIYQNNQDVYSEFAITAFKLDPTRYKDDTGKWKYPSVHKEDHRFPAKTCILASLYRVTAQGLLSQMPVGKGWTEYKVQDLINAFLLKYSEIPIMWRNDDKTAMKYMMVWDMWGRFMHTPGVRSVHPWVVSASLRELANMPIQGGACGIFKIAMAMVHEIWEQAGLSELIHPLLPIHDELLYEVREDMVEEWIQVIGGVFESCVPLEVPIGWSGASANNWGEVEK